MNKQVEIDDVTYESAPEEPKYTVDEVLGAYDTVHNSWAFENREPVKIYLQRKNHPDYLLYLKLKEQFGE